MATRILFSAPGQTAQQAWRAGISCIPILADGTKRPAVRWKPYQRRLPTWAEIERWFGASHPVGIALLTGAVSRGLEACDFDSPRAYQLWAHRMRVSGLSELLMRLEHGYYERTPHGVHLLYCCGQMEGNQKLARRRMGDGAPLQSLIETRGEGGYCIVAPSAGLVHPSGQPYRLVRGSLETIPHLSGQERSQVLAAARLLDQLPPPSPTRSTHDATSWSAWAHAALSNWPSVVPGQFRPGDRFNQHMRWEDLLPRYEWQHVRVVGEVTHWRRPGKRGPGISATTNYAGLDLLYVFSTATIFEPERGYTKFTAYTLLEHGGDFTAAARALVARGEEGL